jgi:hypothetical protein
MAVTVCLPLFGSPGHELEEGSTVKAQQLRDLADRLAERLRKAADTLDKLTAAGWSGHLGMYDIILVGTNLSTREEAVQQLQAMGLNPDDFMILEDVEEEDGDPA